ncbi:hypothetical protein COT97_02180 [Candidatus Falkowbacteria bacterium CG10_big_fil_rev_8_21_14_0_10_39_11]|uniref:TGS domain-containing protein n=1 Tax=Candidatus Falkowbacteria bacterium CG10_big_fil_rev_8_21_14_0_10_39_11 TaxID=1974565 RepID=A0A2H0V594_9BACT|nr:MAG: hypothetical protein COT97_02180 [Candidatus Falkowbacteria bacterium CG10_big_fil_rev_8_21_14_0_10_39_11]
MDQKIQKLIDNLNRVHGHEINEKIIQTVFNLTKDIDDELTKNQAFNNAYNISLKHVPAEIVALEYLYCFKSHIPNLENITKKQTSSNFYKLFKAHDLANIHLDVKLHNRSLLEHTKNTVHHLAELNPDFHSLYAAYLKHLPEYSPISIKDLQKIFGTDVVNIIQATNRLKTICRPSDTNNHESLQQLILTSSKDTRVIILKMCSLIDLLKNIDQIKEKHRIRTATEAMHIYAPIADILGIWRLKWQLEDYSFRFLQPEEYQNIERKFHVDEKKNREKYVAKTIKILTNKAQKNNLHCDVSGRFKHFYSIYQKMNEKQKNFNEIYDVFALRIIVPTIDDCYKALELIHSIWHPVPNRIKDYINAPKKNQYRSLHTTVYGLNNRPTEFQIRTADMDHEARYGKSSHWFYKNNQKNIPDWALKIINFNRSTNHNQDWIQINTEVLFDKIFTYTPKGDVISLPKGATVIDFAYHIHSQVGNSCHSARVNSQTVQLDHELQNEDIVEIISNPKQFLPKEEWLKIITTPIAEKKILQALESDPRHEIYH